MRLPEDQDTSESLDERLQQLERRVEADRLELRRLRAKISPSPSAAPDVASPRSSWLLTLDVVLWLVGSAGVFGYVLGEMQWHWAIALLIAPIGGFVVLMLGRAGVAI